MFSKAALHQPNCKTAVVTPTYNRHAFLRQTYRYVCAQTTTAQVAWFVLDDSAKPISNAPWEQTATSNIEVHYHHLTHKIALSDKRNRLNDMAQEWGADLICSMDDDDWYGATYVETARHTLLNSEWDFAGSGDDYYLDLNTGRIIFFPAVREHMTCNGLMCYTRDVLKTHRYADALQRSEELSFLGQAKVAQLPNVRHLHLALAHTGNTISKHGIVNHTRYHTELTLDDFPMEQVDKAFYLKRIGVA